MHLWRRHAGWVFQIRAPADLESRIGRTPIRIGLGPSTARIAQRRARILVGHAELMFGRLRQGNLAMGEQGDVRDELIAALEGALADAQEVIRQEQQLGALRLDTLERTHQTERLAAERAMGERLSKVRGTFESFEQSFSRHLDNLHHRQEPAGSIQNVIAELKAQIQVVSSSVEKITNQPKPPFLSECLERHIEIARGRGVGEKFAQTKVARLKTFIEFAGDRPASDYVVSDVQLFANALADAPANWMKKSGFRTLTLKQAAARNNELRALSRVPNPSGKQRAKPLPAYGKKTIMNGYVFAVKSIISDLAGEYKFRNPLIEGKIRPPNQARASIPRNTFSVRELNRWFACAAKEKRPDDFWLPLLGTLTGARLGELVFLQGRDIYELPQKPGLWVADLCMGVLLHDGEVPRPIKNEASRRIFALHNALDECGFIRYAKSKKPDEWLFPHLHRKILDPADTASKRINRRLAAYGLHRPWEAVFHSSRHTAKDIMRIARVDTRTSDRQTGHTMKTTSDEYGSKRLRDDEITILAALPLPEGLDFTPYRRMAQRTSGARTSSFSHSQDNARRISEAAR